ncbi:MAG: Mur ligase domain-containing protein [Candidatus Paceibacterota bacterium]
MHTTLKNVSHLHCIGIGGIGLSALARMFLLKGIPVSGSDISESKVTDELIELGARITFGQEESTIEESVDLVLYTIAIPTDDPELIDAERRGITTMTYPEALGFISKSFKTIAIAGTHGKTTTTAMTAEALIASGLDPTVVVGSFLKNAESNFISGKSSLFVVEACEYRESFLHLNPNILVITNIEEDHLDYYTDLNHIIRAFNTLALKVPEDGYIIADLGNPTVQTALSGAVAHLVNYIDVLAEVEVSVPGEHNRKNAAAALSVARALGASDDTAREALRQFSGTWRRFEKKGETQDGVLVYDDYAHHPTEIRATLSAMRELYPDKKVLAIFQPHLFSRTRLLLHDFAQAFTQATEVLILPIYKAREVDGGTVSSLILAEETKKYHPKVQSVDTTQDTLRITRAFIEENGASESVLITLGAGEAYKVGEQFLKEYTD